jgi:LAO/AO transport system kinase
MKSLAEDPKVFIRSMATRGEMGGLSPSIQEALVVLDAAGYEVLIVETVGVGQDEVDIVRTADVSMVVLVPGMGDDVQTIKAGVMEIGDLFVINKAERDGALRTEQDLEALLSLGTRDDGWDPPIVRTVAVKGEGTEELIAAIDQCQKFVQGAGRFTERKKTLVRERILGMLKNRITTAMVERSGSVELDTLTEKVMSHELDPYTVVDRLVSNFCLEEADDD